MHSPFRCGRSGILFGFLNVASLRVEPPERADIQALWVLVKEIESLFFRLYSEKALRESEQRYRSLWESALEGSRYMNCLSRTEWEDLSM